jgi:hypothetical protein
MDSVIEVVILDSKTSMKEEFDAALKQWVEFLKKQSGYVTSTYLQSVDKPRVLVQFIEFESQEQATAILVKYRDYIGQEKFDAFNQLLNRRPAIEYYKKIEL